MGSELGVREGLLVVVDVLTVVVEMLVVVAVLILVEVMRLSCSWNSCRACWANWADRR